MCCRRHKVAFKSRTEFEIQFAVPLAKDACGMEIRMETEKKKVLVLGMYEEAMYHPMKGVDTYLQKICPEVEFTFTEEPADLCEAEQYDGVISYWDDWNTPICAEGANALYRYVEKGGVLLVLHNGISLQMWENLKEMIGARFLTHPKQEEIVFCVREHPLTEGCKDFSLVEEPYQFEMEEDEKEIFLTYLYRGEEYPAGWRKSFGEGEIIYLTPGHTPEKFENVEYTKLIQNCISYLCAKGGSGNGR